MSFGGVVASWLARLSLYQAVQGSSPGQGHCVVFLGKTFTLTVPLSIQVYKWVLTNSMFGGNPAMD